MATIDLGKIKQVFRGTYNNATAYVPDDLVVFTDTNITSTYICTTASTGNNPSSGGTAHANWAYVAKGVADPIPSQSGNAGKFLKTNGSALSFDQAGGLLQVVVNEKSGVTSISGQNNSGTFDDVTGYNISITPTAASSKILVQYTIGKYSHNGNTTAFRFTRSVAGGSATVIKVNTNLGSRKAVSSNILGSNLINSGHAQAFNYKFVDTPSYSVGQAIVYQMQVLTEGSNNFYVNRTVDDTDNSNIYFARAFSTITAMEVSA